ncbi:MAG: hypothetical protein RLZ98_1922 [Pseudomonadota bacterium]|jgi:hypothetical protein
MRKFFTGLTAILLLAFAAVHASRMLEPWQLEIAGRSIPPLASLVVAAVVALLSIAVLFEMRSTARSTTETVSRSVSRSYESRAPLAFTVRQGKRYRAAIQLSWWEQAVATNEYIANQLTSVGFTDVAVTGTGAQREAEGLWPHPDQTAEMPSQIVSASEVKEAGEPAPSTVASTGP